MSGTRALIDAFMKKYSLLKDDIQINSRRVHNPDFENGIVEMQTNREVILEAEAQQKKRAKVSKYRSTAYVTPVSLICEQRNSISKHIRLPETDGSFNIRNADDIEAQP